MQTKLGLYTLGSTPFQIPGLEDEAGDALLPYSLYVQAKSRLPSAKAQYQWISGSIVFILPYT